MFDIENGPNFIQKRSIIDKLKIKTLVNLIAELMPNKNWINECEDDESDDVNENNLIGNNHCCFTKPFFPELHSFKHINYKP